jgi:hypothetical protein
MFLPPKTQYTICRNRQTDKHILLIYNEFYLKILTFQKFYQKKYNLYFQISANTVNQSSQLNDFLVKWHSYPTNKIKFSGKGYKIIKNQFCLNLSLNTSHNQWAFFFKTLPIKIHKQRFLFFNKNTLELKHILTLLVNARLVNIYTKRGLRLGRQQIMKKVGKRSS